MYLMLQNDREVQGARIRINQQGLRYKLQSQEPVLRLPNGP